MKSHACIRGVGCGSLVVRVRRLKFACPEGMGINTVIGKKEIKYCWRCDYKCDYRYS